MSEGDWAKVIIGAACAILSGVLGYIIRRQDIHEAKDEARFDALAEKLDAMRDELKREMVPRGDLQALVYAGILAAVKDYNADFRTEWGRQMGLMAGRLDDLLGQIGRIRDAQRTYREDLIVVATKLNVDLPQRSRE